MWQLETEQSSPTLMWIRAWLNSSTALSLVLCSKPLLSASRSNWNINQDR